MTDRPDYLRNPIGWMHPDFAADAYDEVSLWAARFGVLLFDNLELRRGIRGLDVACGAGFPLFELAHAHGPSSRFVGIDLWVEALIRARGKIAVHGLRNVEVAQTDAATLPFADESFDLITSNLGINNFADPPAVMRECHRVAKPGARIAMTSNLRGHMAELYDVFRTTLRELGRDELLPALDAQEAHRDSREDIEQLLTGAGFTITRVVESELRLAFADGSALFRHSLVKFFLDGWRRVTDDAEIYLAMEEKLNRGGELRMKVPMLYAEAVR